SDANGGWVGSAADLVKFAVMLDGSRPRALLETDTIRAMLAAPPRALWMANGMWYGLGLMVQPTLTSLAWSHSGGFAGTSSLLVHAEDGIVYAFVFNTRPRDQASLSDYVSSRLWDVFSGVARWPQHDLFPAFYPPRVTAARNAASGLEGPLAAGSIAALEGL